MLGSRQEEGKPMKQLILGGARSGKSRLAEQLAGEGDRPVVFVATALAEDAEMQQRIARHQQERNQEWALVEEPLALADVLQDRSANECVLIDCLTLWVTNLLLLEDESRFQRETAAFLESVEAFSGDLILVSNETGLGVVPMGELTRRFVDESGWLHQSLAAMCDRVIFTVAGLPMVLKGEQL